VNRRWRVYLAACWLLVVAAGTVAQQKPSRLLVMNETGATVEVFVAVKNTWQSRGRVPPKSSLPVFNVANGQRVRAVWGSRSALHTVKLTYDRAYGGWQDRMVVK
jgi:hypothetical protein